MGHAAIFPGAPKLGVYVHWPFCMAKCPYCDFNSHVWREVDHPAWRDGLLAELAHMRELTGPRPVETIFFGGGTPSLMQPNTVARLIEEVDRLWGLSGEAEVTLEANPTSVEAEKFQRYADAGVNRLSMGVQALDDHDLALLGRQHSVGEARAAFDVARDVFGRISFDLIYARKGQSVDGWVRELETALDMAADHLSLYQLTIEPGTRFHEMAKRGQNMAADNDTAAEMFAITQQLTRDAGMLAYEVSNHAAPGAESRHNLIYWRGDDYVGVGPGAHGRLSTPTGERVAVETERDPAKWLWQVARAGHAVSVEDRLSGSEMATEYMLMSMRLSEGTDLARFRRLGGRLCEAGMRRMAEQGLISLGAARVVATPQGRLVLDHVLKELLA